MALKSKLRSLRRFIPLASALLLAALVAIPSSGVALAQAPPDELTLVNADRDFVERKKGGEFVARPLFDREIADLFYAVRDADTGDWISAMYRVKGGEKKRGDGWEYSWEYPDLDEHTDLDRDRAYLLVMLATAEDGLRGDFYEDGPVRLDGVQLGVCEVMGLEIDEPKLGAFAGALNALDFPAPGTPARRPSGGPAEGPTPADEGRRRVPRASAQRP